MPKLEYPSLFEGDLLGAKCIEDIKYREAFLCVPFKMIISVGKAMKHPVLGQIIEANSIFKDDSEEKKDWEHMVLCLFLFYEITLGTKSYWFPYLRLMPDIDFTANWTDSELMFFEDSNIFLSMKNRHQSIENRWVNFK